MVLRLVISSSLAPLPPCHTPAAWWRRLQWGKRSLCHWGPDVPLKVFHTMASLSRPLEHIANTLALKYPLLKLFKLKSRNRLTDRATHAHKRHLSLHSEWKERVSPWWALICGSTLCRISRDFLWYSAWTSMSYRKKNMVMLNSLKVPKVFTDTHLHWSIASFT